MGYPNVFGPNGFLAYNHDPIKTVKILPRPVLAGRVATATATEVTICIGDPYTLDTLGNAMHAGPGDVVYGIVAAIGLNAVFPVMFGQGPVSQEILTAGEGGYIMGYESMDYYFEVQTPNFTPSNIGGLFNLVDAAYHVRLRQSRVYLGTTAAGTQFRAIDIIPRPTDNTYGPNARVICRLNQAVA